MKKIDMKTRYESSVKFLRSAFLVCPLCAMDGCVTKVGKAYFIVTCPCTKWRIDFKIREV